MNAAVEAGLGSGRGSRWVRNLAGCSTSAAKQIQTLITDSGTKVEQGNEMVAESGRLLRHIITEVEQMPTPSVR